MIRLVETPVDFETCAAIYADVEPEQRVTAEQLATADGVSLLSGDDGMAYVTRSSVTSAAFAMVRVRPSARRRGVGSALLAAVAEHARALDRHLLWGRVHEPDVESLRFVEKRGFRQVTRDIDILLTVAPGDGAQAQLHWASRSGVVQLVTWTQKGNAAMQALNRSLGYVDKGKVLTYQGPLP